MIELLIRTPIECQVIQKVSTYKQDKKLHLSFVFAHDVVFEAGAFFIGFSISNAKKNQTFLMTHEQSVNNYKIPFAFPAFIGVFGEKRDRGLFMEFDYYKLPKSFKQYKKIDKSRRIEIGLTNDAFKVKAGEIIDLECIYQIYTKDAPTLTELIKNCAHYTLERQPVIWNNEYSYTTNIYDYSDAAYGLSNNLLDHRSRIQDGTGTFIPYGYLETNPYSESFALMDVAKGMLPYAIWLRREDLVDLMMSELIKMTDDKADFPWIDDDHNTNGFFHLAWGSLPVGVSKEYIKTQSIGLFSDVDGHEEGPNLLSTWKYFYRVEILGEMALLSNNRQIIDGFLKTLPFVNKLKMKNYAQPVTYDLDSHLPATGFEDGGSAGGSAFWSMVHLTAYKLTNEKTYLDEALKALEHANHLDFDHYYSMRVAPKPVTVGWLTKANTFAYELTGDKHYLDAAKRASQAIYFFYYLSPHPYTYFSTLGFGYACSRERWEAFLEMVESLYAISFYLKYTRDQDLLKLFWFARENWLWALPLNGNPYGNSTRPYDSIGGEYIPYEFSTGSLGDNPGIEGGSQSSMRQIKEIYGSGEVYLSYMMFQMNAHVTNRQFLVIKTDRVNDLLNDELNFIVYNTKEKAHSCIISFSNLTQEAYQVYTNDGVVGTYRKEQLYMGICFGMKAFEVMSLKLAPSLKGTHKILSKINDLIVEFSGYENISIKWTPIIHPDFSHYRINITNDMYTRQFDLTDNQMKHTIDRELTHKIEVIAIYTNYFSYYPTVELGVFLEEYKYRLDLYKPGFTFTNSDLIQDGHLFMFYGNDNVKNFTVDVKIEHKFSKNDLLQIELGSMNTSNTYELYLMNESGSYIKIHESNHADLFEYRLDQLAFERLVQLRLIVSGNQGLGCSIKRIDILDIEPTYNQRLALLKNKKTTRNKDDYSLEYMIDSTGYEFVDIYLENMSKEHGFKVFFDGVEQETIFEKQFPDKKYRHMNGIYRFTGLYKPKMKIVVSSTSDDMQIYLIRLTNNRQYPKYAEHKKYKEGDYEKEQ